MVQAGDSGSDQAGQRAADELMPELYGELRRIAGRHFRQQGASDSLQPTMLVHEAYLRLAKKTTSDIDGRTHFIALAATAMRQIIIDHARRRARVKHGAGAHRVTLSDARIPGPTSEIDLLELNDALEKLAELDQRKARVVELRIFGGLTIQETAAALEVSHMTVSTDWRMASAWLANELGA